MPSRRLVVVASVLMVALAADFARAQVVSSEWNTGSGFWNVPANWSPVGVPDNGGGVTFNVQIGNRAVATNALVRFTPQDGTSDTVSTLSVTGGADLLTNANQLNVLTQTTVDGAGTTLRIEPHSVAGTPAFTTLNLDLNNGSGLTMSGGIASVGTSLEINSSTISGFGVINLGDLDATAEQAFDNSGLIQVLGTNATPGTLTLHANGVDTIDLDGDTELGVVDVANVAANLQLDTLTLVVDGPLADAFGGSGTSLQIGQRDTITFNRNFQLAAGAAIQMDGGNNVATLNGAGAITAINGASFTIAGDAVIANNMTFSGAANSINVAANGSLALNGTVAIPQATAIALGAGSELIIGGAATITDAANDFDWDGNPANTTIQGTGILTLNVDQIDVGSDTYNSTLNLNDDGDLTVNVTGTSWAMAGTLNKNGAGTSTIAGDAMNVTGAITVNAGTLTLPTTTLASGATATINGGELKGGTITVGNANGIQGAGLVTARVINNTRFRADAGTLVVQAPANDNDWDGAANTGLLTAVNGGVLEMRDNATFGFNGTVTATGNSRVFANQFGIDFNPGSTINLTSSKYQAAETTNIGGAVNIAAGGDSTIEVQVNRFLEFEATSVTTLNSNLRLVSNNIEIAAGATFGGTGAIVIPDGSHAILSANSNVNVLFDNQGALRIAGFEAVGRADVRDYQQRAAQSPADVGGELFVELTGTSLNQFDRLVVNGAALIGGYLNIDIDGGFVPALGNTFNIISASAGVSGAFDLRDISGMPAGLTFQINYLPTAVTLQVVSKPFFSADFDEDGDVDFTDLAIWDAAFDLNQLGDANGDNRTDIDDWTLWRDQFGSIPGPPGAMAVPEPATGSTLIAIAVFGLCLRMLQWVRGMAKTAALSGAIALAAISSDAAAAPIMSVTDNGLVGGNRQWLVRVAPDAALLAAGHKSLAVELGFHVTDGELLSAAVNTSAWPFNLPANNSPFGGGSDGLNVDTAADTVFAALGSGLFNNSSLVPVLTIVTEGDGAATLTWGGYNVPGLNVTGARIAQAGTSFNGYQGALSVGSIPGDIDLNGAVNKHDAALFAQHFGKTVGALWSTGDFDGDGATTLHDLALLQSHLGSPAPAPQAAAAVPEPTTMALTVIALLLMVGASSAGNAARRCAFRKLLLDDE
jgi:hypothetical protein